MTDQANPLFTNLLRLADDHLVLGHRLSEWCGHAPILEEDLAMPNIALDLIGQARALYSHAGLIEGKQRDEDKLAYWRLEREYTNLLMCERNNGDFAHTMLRQLLFSSYMQAYWKKACASSDAVIAGIAGKAVKESSYHVRHCGEWVIRLGDGTEESLRRTSAALDALTPYLAEMFESDAVTQHNEAAGLLPEPAMLHNAWREQLMPILAEGRLSLPELQPGQSGGRRGRHTEAMGYLLAELQFVQRSHPGLTW